MSFSISCDDLSVLNCCRLMLSLLIKWLRKWKVGLGSVCFSWWNHQYVASFDDNVTDIEYIIYVKEDLCLLMFCLILLNFPRACRSVEIEALYTATPVQNIDKRHIYALKQNELLINFRLAILFTHHTSILCKIEWHQFFFFFFFHLLLKFLCFYAMNTRKCSPQTCAI